MNGSVDSTLGKAYVGDDVVAVTAFGEVLAGTANARDFGAEGLRDLHVLLIVECDISAESGLLTRVP